MEPFALLQHRVIFLNRSLSAETANALIEQLLLLDALDHGAPIDFYINCAGGSVTDGLALLDVMACIAAPISTICVGQASSMAAWVLAAGTPGLRRATPHAEVMIHQVAGGFSGHADDIQFYAQRVVRLQQRLVQLLAAHSGQPSEKIGADMARDFFMSAREALAYGLIDAVVEPFKKPRFALGENKAPDFSPNGKPVAAARSN